MCDSWENGVTVFSSTARTRKEQGEWKCCSIAGERKLSLSKPWMLGGFWKIKHLSSFSAWFHTRHPGCPGALGSVPWLLATSCSRVVAQALKALPATRIWKIHSFPEPEGPVLYSAKSLKHGKSYSVSQSRIIFHHQECTSIFEIRLKPLFADVKIQTSLNKSNVPNSL